jgi:hypothetical protein
MNDTEHTEFFTEPEYARYTRRSPRTAQRERAAGVGPEYIRLGARILYRRKDVDAWLDQHVRGAPAAASAVEARPIAPQLPSDDTGDKPVCGSQAQPPGKRRRPRKIVPKARAHIAERDSPSSPPHKHASDVTRRLDELCREARS